MVSEVAIKCSDPELRERLERMSAVDVGLAPELQPIFALMDAYDFFHLIEEGSSKVEEIIRFLSRQSCGPP